MDLALPNLHPAIVHFPIVLLPLALLLDIGAMVRRGAAWNRIAALSWVVAALAATAAFVAGRDAADGLVGLDPRVQPAIGDHADWATWTLVIVWTIAVLRAAAWGLSSRQRLSMLLRVIVLIAGVGIQGMLVLTADKGGALVFRHAVAVVVPDCPTCAAPAEVPPPAAKNGLTLQDVDGTVAWAPGPGELGALGTSEWPSRGVAVKVQGTETLLLPPVLGDVQVNAWLDLSHFTGEVWVLHHFDGSTGGAFVASTKGEARLVDLAPDEAVLDRSTSALSGRMALSVSASGKHLKGMIDGRMVVHGHTDARPAGQVGLRFVGEGVAAVERVEAVRLAPAH
jgi:uncharacterized membrane protein